MSHITIHNIFRTLFQKRASTSTAPIGLHSTNFTLSRAKSSPVPGVVDYFRPVLAAVQELSRARSSRSVPGVVTAV